MSENDKSGFGRTGIVPYFSARNTSRDPLDNMIDGRDDPNRGPLDRAANALDGRDDPNRGPLDRAANALDGRDDPNRGPLDRAANALDGRDDPNRGPLDRMTNAVAGGSAMTGAATGAGSMAATDGSSRNMVSAVFDSEAQAERAVSELRSAGISDSALSIIAQHGRTTTTTSGTGEVTDESHSNLLRGILGGGALGAGLGIVALAIPGVGPLAAAGAIAGAAIPEAMAIGAVAGAALGTLNEVLTKHGVSDEDASYYGERIKDGGVFVSVDTGTGGVSAATAQDILYRNGGHSSSQSKMI